MPPKFAGRNGIRGGAPFDPSTYPPISDHYSTRSQIPRSQMPPKFAGSQGRGSVAGRKVKQVWRRKPSPPPPWIELPPDITANILHRLGAIEILETAEKVCTTWRSVCKDPAMWRVIDMRNHGDPTDMLDFDKMCRHAVDRSQGQLVDINLEYFACPSLLDYISGRCGNLRRLRLSCCYNLSDKDVIESIKRLPHLEELHILLTPISDETIEMVGRSCPLLKSFIFHKLAPFYYIVFVNGMDDGVGDKDALAIASSMPELRHLRLLENGLTNKGLEAILDGCPHLESLDLRCCSHVKLIGNDLRKRLSSQVKCLKYPDDSPSDCEFQFQCQENDDDDGYDDYNDYDLDVFEPDIFNYGDIDFDEINIDNYHLYFDDYSRPDHPDYHHDDEDDPDFFPFFPF